MDDPIPEASPWRKRTPSFEVSMDLNSVPSDFSEYEEEYDVVPSTQIPTPSQESFPQTAPDASDRLPSSAPEKKKQLWPPNATDNLLDEFADVKLNVIRKGNLGLKHYDLIAQRINRYLSSTYTGKQAKNRIEFMIRRYKHEKDKENGTGGTPSTWQYFDQLDQVLGSSAKCGGLPGGSTDEGFRSGDTSTSNVNGNRKRSEPDLGSAATMQDQSTKKQKGASILQQMESNEDEVTVIEDDEGGSNDADQVTPTRDLKEKLPVVSSKKGSSSLNGKKTKSRRLEDGVRGAASILAGALKDITVIQKDLKLMELQAKKDAAERAEHLQLQIAERKETLKLQLAEMQMRLQMDLQARLPSHPVGNITAPSENTFNGEDPFLPSGSSSRSYYQYE